MEKSDWVMLTFNLAYKNAALYRSPFVLSYRKSTNNYIYQCGKQVVENEVYGHQWSPHLSHCHQSLVHDIHPSLLCKNLEHGHKCLQERKREIISLYFLSVCIFFYQPVFLYSFMRKQQKSFTSLTAPSASAGYFESHTQLEEHKGEKTISG